MIFHLHYGFRQRFAFDHETLHTHVIVGRRVLVRPALPASPREWTVEQRETFLAFGAQQTLPEYAPRVLGWYQTKDAAETALADFPAPEWEAEIQPVSTHARRSQPAV